MASLRNGTASLPLLCWVLLVCLLGALAPFSNAVNIAVSKKRVKVHKDHLSLSHASSSTKVQASTATNGTGPTGTSATTDEEEGPLLVDANGNFGTDTLVEGSIDEDIAPHIERKTLLASTGTMNVIDVWTATFNQEYAIMDDLQFQLFFGKGNPSSVYEQAALVVAGSVPEAALPEVLVIAEQEALPTKVGAKFIAQRINDDPVLGQLYQFVDESNIKGTTKPPNMCHLALGMAVLKSKAALMGAVTKHNFQTSVTKLGFTMLKGCLMHEFTFNSIKLGTLSCHFDTKFPNRNVYETFQKLTTALDPEGAAELTPQATASGITSVMRSVSGQSQTGAVNIEKVSDAQITTFLADVMNFVDKSGRFDALILTGDLNHRLLDPTANAYAPPPGKGADRGPYTTVGAISAMCMIDGFDHVATHLDSYQLKSALPGLGFLDYTDAPLPDGLQAQMTHPIIPGKGRTVVPTYKMTKKRIDNCKLMLDAVNTAAIAPAASQASLDLMFATPAVTAEFNACVLKPGVQEENKLKSQNFNDGNGKVKVVNLGFLDKIVVRANPRYTGFYWYANKDKFGFSALIHPVLSSDHLPLHKRIVMGAPKIRGRANALVRGKGKLAGLGLP